MLFNLLKRVSSFIILIILTAPSDILCELGVRSFSGSRDVPKDFKKACGFFENASINSTEQELLNV